MRIKFSNLVSKHFDPENPLIFFHLPKTAGTTMADILSMVYGESYLRASPVEMLALLKKSCMFDPYRAMLGHYTLNDPFYQKINFTFNHFVIVRDPVDRVVSQYYYLRGQEVHPLHSLAMQYSLEDIFKTDHIYQMGMANTQARLLSAFPRATDSKLTVAHAKLNLSGAFTFFGLFDRLEEFIKICGGSLGWPEVDIPMSNSSSRPSAEEIPEALKRVIKENNLLDELVYIYAKKLYTERVKDYEYILNPKEPEEVVEVIEAIALEAHEGELGIDEHAKEVVPVHFKRIRNFWKWLKGKFFRDSGDQEEFTSEREEFNSKKEEDI